MSEVRGIVWSFGGLALALVLAIFFYTVDPRQRKERESMADGDFMNEGRKEGRKEVGVGVE